MAYAHMRDADMMLREAIIFDEVRVGAMMLSAIYAVIFQDYFRSAILLR